MKPAPADMEATAVRRIEKLKPAAVAGDLDAGRTIWRLCLKHRLARPTWLLLALMRGGALQRLEHNKAAIADANTSEDDWSFFLLESIDLVGFLSIPLPGWLAERFHAAFARVGNADVLSWDEAFGRPYPKGTNAAALRKRLILGARVVDAVEAASDAGARGRAARFGPVCAELSIGMSYAQELYREERQRRAGPPRRVAATSGQRRSTRQP